MNQYAYYGKGKTIHSSGQLEYFENLADDESVKVKGAQCVVTNDRFEIPISIKNGLLHVTSRPCTDAEWDTLPHTEVTSDTHWDPTVLD